MSIVISEGTLKVIDLLIDFESWLEHNHPDKFRRAQAIYWTTTMLAEQEGWNKAFEANEDKAYDYFNHIWELMEQSAPKGMWFGAHQGDGALFGFWEITEEEEH